MEIESFRHCYHGTTNVYAEDIMGNIDINRGRYYTDFGQGFYLTTCYEQAVRQAKRRTEDAIGDSVAPALVKVELNTDLLTELFEHTLGFVFEEANDEWAEFVYACRVAGKYENIVLHDYEFVIGPVADGFMGRSIRLFERNQLTKEQFRDSIKPSGNLKNQISFHTERSLSTIMSKEVVQIEFSSL